MRRGSRHVTFPDMALKIVQPKLEDIVVTCVAEEVECWVMRRGRREDGEDGGATCKLTSV